MDKKILKHALRNVIESYALRHRSAIVFVHNLMRSPWLADMLHVQASRIMVVFTTPHINVARSLGAVVIPVSQVKSGKSKSIIHLLTGEHVIENAYRRMACEIVDFITPAVDYIEAQAKQKGWEHVLHDLVDPRTRLQMIWKEDLGERVMNYLEQRWAWTDPDDRKRLLALAALPLLNCYTVEECQKIWGQQTSVTSLILERLEQRHWLKRIPNGSYRMTPIVHDFLVRKNRMHILGRIREVYIPFVLWKRSDNRIRLRVQSNARGELRVWPKRIKHPLFRDIDPTNRGWSYLIWLKREPNEATTGLRLCELVEYVQLSIFYYTIIIALFMFFVLSYSSNLPAIIPLLIYALLIAAASMGIIQINKFFARYEKSAPPANRRSGNTMALETSH